LKSFPSKEQRQAVLASRPGSNPTDGSVLALSGVESLCDLQRKAAQERWRSLETNRDSLPNYGKRYRARACRSRAAFTESTVNEVVAKRMNKNQQMRWNRYTVQPFLTVRVHVLNGTLEDAIRAMHRDFRPPKCPPVVA